MVVLNATPEICSLFNQLLTVLYFTYSYLYRTMKQNEPRADEVHVQPSSTSTPSSSSTKDDNLQTPVAIKTGNPRRSYRPGNGLLRRAISKKIQSFTDIFWYLFFRCPMVLFLFFISMINIVSSKAMSMGNCRPLSRGLGFVLKSFSNLKKFAKKNSHSSFRKLKLLKYR